MLAVDQSLRDKDKRSRAVEELEGKEVSIYDKALFGNYPLYSECHSASHRSRLEVILLLVNAYRQKLIILTTVVLMLGAISFHLFSRRHNFGVFEDPFWEGGFSDGGSHGAERRRDFPGEPIDAPWP